MGIASGILSAAGNMTGTMASATKPNVPSVLSNNNIEKQIPRIIVNTWSDEKELADVMASLHLYGYTYPLVKSVKDNTRVWWDYCQTENCSIPQITNYYDRKVIEDAFNRGVTKWHYGPFGLQHNFLRDINNIERKYISSEDAQISFNFTKDVRPLENYGTVGNVVTFTNNGATVSTTNGLTFDSTGSYIQTNNFTEMGITPDDTGCVVTQIFRFGNVPSTGTYGITSATGNIYVSDGILQVYGDNTGISASQLNGKCLTVQVGTFIRNTPIRYRRLYVYIDGELMYENPPGPLYDGAQYYGYDTKPVNIIFGYFRPSGDSAKPASTELQIKKFKMYFENYPQQTQLRSSYWTQDQVNQHII